MTTIKLAITDFAEKNIQTGHIDERASMSAVAVELGAEIHRSVQRQRHEEMSSYVSESGVEEVIPVTPEIRVMISGRIDGMWQDEDGFVIEEIKSTLKMGKLIAQMLDDHEHPYILQVKLYSWIIWKQRGTLPKAQILVIAAGSRETRVFPVEFDPEEFSQWVQTRSQWIVQLWSECQVHKAERKDLAKKLKFPFAKKREGQITLLEDVTETCKNKSQMLAQAPTGIGKTAAVMFPMLKAAMRTGDKLFYVTPKNSQLREAEKFLARLTRRGYAVKGIIVTAKPKICMQEVVHCTPEACPFAKNHYDKVNENQLIEKLKNEPIINQKVLRSYAEKYVVCPYELGRQVMPWLDLVAGDYHYALAPQGSLRDVAALPLTKDPKPLLAIDEAHNLSERALDWYTAQVIPIPDDAIRNAPRKLKNHLKKLNLWLASQRSLAPKARPIVPALDRESLENLMEKWSGQMTIILETLEGPTESDPLVSAWFSWLNFFDLTKLPTELSFAMANHETHAITLHCANAGPLMRETLAKYKAVVGFSATLKPFAYHRTMCGFNPDQLVTREYQSPFPSKNRCIIAIPQVSTAWRDRPRSIPKIAEVIDRITSIKSGNYVAFFPSFELLRQTKPLIKSPGLEILEQPSQGGQSWVKEIITTLKHRRGILLLAVQGGMMSEGVDLPGDALIGAFVIGPAIPMITPEREERRRILGASGLDGFAQAYIYPAMARSVQSAGRVLRTPSDRGVIILLDQRFLQAPYTEALPKDWLTEKESPKDLASQTILRDITQFWGNQEQTPSKEF